MNLTGPPSLELMMLMDLPEIQIGCTDNGSVDLTTLEVPTSDVNRYKAAGASGVDRHAWSFNIEKMADSVAEDCASDSNSD